MSLDSTARFALTVAAVASATVGCGSTSKSEEPLSSDVVRTYAGITCTWPVNLSEGGALCHLANGTGLATVIARRFVIVCNFRTKKIVLTRNQPDHSAGYEVPADRRIFHRETHQAISC